jgi:hypothetical protein
MIGERLLRVLHHAVVILLVVGSAVALTAQTVVDPRFVEFAPSPDHNTLAPNGTPLVQRYSLSIFAVGSSVAFDTMDLGKPAPSAGVIRVDFLPLLHAAPTPDVVFEARVTAVGPGGSTGSTASNGFSFAAACAPSINSTGQSVGAGLTTGSVGVTAGSGCTWSAVSNAGWITLTGATSGSGNGSVPYSVAANSSTSARTGTLTVAGRTYTINQAGTACTYTISSNTLSVVAGGGTGSTNVTSSAGCAWSAVSNAGWITVTSGATGSGNGSAGFSVAVNPNATTRTGTLTIAGRTFTVNQAAAACTFTVSPTSRTVAASGGSSSTGVTAPTGCAWTAVSNDSWITVTSGASGNGNGTVNFSATVNTATQARIGTVTIAGRTLTVTQNAATCNFTISPSTQSVAAGGATGSTTVTTTAGCAWTAASNVTWITLTGEDEGSGSGPVTFTVAPSTSSSARTGTLSIAGRTFTVTQAANTCNFMLTPSSRTMTGTGGTGMISVSTTSGCNWTAATTQSWISVNASGTTAGQANYTVQPNTTGSTRTGTISIGTQVFTITQSSTTTPAAPAGLRIIAITGGQ